MSMLTATRPAAVGPRYKWIVLSNTTIGMLLATSTDEPHHRPPGHLPGIHLNPLEPANFPYLLWIMMGYMRSRPP